MHAICLRCYGLSMVCIYQCDADADINTYSNHYSDPQTLHELWLHPYEERSR